MSTYRFHCAACDIPASSVRCSRCGNDTQERETAPQCGSIFGHAQMGYLGRAAEKAAPRRFTGESLTGFGSLT